MMMTLTPPPKAPDVRLEPAAELDRLKDELLQRLLQGNPRSEVREIEERIRQLWRLLDGSPECMDEGAAF